MTNKVLNVVVGPFPDIRLEKTSTVLSESGRQVDILCTSFTGNRDSLSKTIFTFPERLPLVQRISNRLLSFFDNPTTKFPKAYLDYYETLLTDYSVVQWNDLFGSLEACQIAHQRGIKFVLDLHENYPYNIWSTARDLNLKGKRYDLNTWFKYEKLAVTKADVVLVTVVEMAERLIGMHGVPFDKFSVIENAENPETWSSIPMNEALQTRFQNKKVILYVGSCSLHRGLDDIIRALQLIGDPDLHLVIVGDGKGIQEWKSLARSLKIDDQVHFEGRKPFEEAQKYYLIATIGVIPHKKYGQTDNTVPHKLYQNFAMGIPTLVSSCHALERIIQETEAGLSYAAGFPTDAAEKIKCLLFHPDFSQLRMNALSTAKSGEHSWQKMQNTLSQTYNQLLPCVEY